MTAYCRHAGPPGSTCDRSCDGVFWDGCAWHVCLSRWLGTGRRLEPVETAYYGGPDGCYRALARWLVERGVIKP